MTWKIIITVGIIVVCVVVLLHVGSVLCANMQDEINQSRDQSPPP